MAARLMIYGANGYTGTLIAEVAVAAGLAPVLAGRNGREVAALAARLGCASLRLALGDRAALEAALGEVDAVIHCAGPFAVTWEPMARACIATGTHYIDITGEVEVFQGCADLGPEAAAAGVMLLPGAGFDVVPTDCLAAMLKARLPDAAALSLAFGGIERPSRGTMRTATRNFGAPTRVRRGGRLVDREGPRSREVDFGDGPVRVSATTWGDLVTAFHSTGIGEIEVFMQVPQAQREAMNMSAPVRLLMATPLRHLILKAKIDAAPIGPDAAERARGASRFWGEARTAAGEAVQLKMRAPEAYALTSRTAVEIARRVLDGEAKPGFQTPSGCFGAGFILGFEGVRLIEE